jgi:prolipoprotein diacylglyceryl transferase
VNFLAFLQWNFEPELLPGIFGSTPFHPRWYGLLFAVGFIVGYQIMLWIFKTEKKNQRLLDYFTIAVIIGVVVGARLGHCLFYDPVAYLSDPVTILYIWEGGLASHGGAIGILIALYIFTKKNREIGYLWSLDRIVVVVALAGVLIRIGNFLNSEILGTPSDLPWAVIFLRGGDMAPIPRHPVQIYESLCYLAIFLFLLFRYKKFKNELPTGTNLGYFLVLVFGARFLLEFIKEEQAAFIEHFPLTMGQILSIPFIIGGLYLLLRHKKAK